SFARSANAGLVVTSSPVTAGQRDLIIELAGRYKLPTIYYERFLAAAGGLLSYTPDCVNQYRRGGGYVDRILSGETPQHLPVQAQTGDDLVINLRTARCLGLRIAEALAECAGDASE